VAQASRSDFPAEPAELVGYKMIRISVSGGIARSDLMCEILAAALDRQLERLVSFEGPAPGAAVTALETKQRREKGIKESYAVADAVAQMVKFRQPVGPNPAWREGYRLGFAQFEARLS
jgi:sugar (pentulose or hexulose) kinase